VFTARYALSPYIKQICFAFKGLSLLRKEHVEHVEKDVCGFTTDQYGRILACIYVYVCVCVYIYIYSLTILYESLQRQFY
jgi:hypothetical protein